MVRARACAAPCAPPPPYLIFACSQLYYCAVTETLSFLAPPPRCRFLVLDEADRMCDMGFEDSIRAIINCIPAQRQTLLFTATWPRGVQRLADEFAPRAVTMSVGGATEELSANMNIAQSFEFLSGEGAKLARLQALFETKFMVPPTEPGAHPTAVKAGHGKAIVFVKFKQSCDRIAQVLWDAGFAVNTLHGDMMQGNRTKVRVARAHCQRSVYVLLLVCSIHSIRSLRCCDSAAGD